MRQKISSVPCDRCIINAASPWFMQKVQVKKRKEKKKKLMCSFYKIFSFFFLALQSAIHTGTQTS